MTRKRTKGWGYTRAGLVAIEDVLPLILDPLIEKAEFMGHKVKVTSLRLQTFARKGLECSSCGVKATHFAVEAHENIGDNWHLNLWADRSADDKGEMLMTHDHTLARGLGGKDHIDNCTVMCSKCNYQKSIAETVEFHRRNGLPPPGSAKAAKVKGKPVSNKEQLNTIPMELAVRMYQASLVKAAKKKAVS